MNKLRKRFNMFLMEIVIRIAKHWKCNIELSNPDENDNIKWMKLVFPHHDK